MSLLHVFAIIVGSWGQLGVDVFIIISAYFLCQKNQFRSAKAINLVFETILYGALWAFVCILVLHMELGVGQIFKAVFSLFFGSYWFATAYLLMYCISPFLNEMLKHCSNAFLKKLTVVLLIIVSLYKTIYKTAPVCELMFFICIYVLIYTVEKTDLKEWFVKNAKKGFIISTIVLSMITFIISEIGDILNNSFILSHSYYLNLRGSIFILFDAICLFYCIKDLPPRTSKTVNLIASTGLGVFLSHQGLSFYFWSNLLGKDLGTSWLSCGYMVVAIVIIYFGCVMIDLMRQYTLERLINATLNKKMFKLYSVIDKALNEST